ncbi:hypothetical protein SAMN05443244_2255 [Terriglobus roseus]|uniref:Uncharacterized protein n=1 Tax=Terriglobus roseus TaxID=392734 RepID=A0A1H4NIK3_9BACT|nr:hypothetical protein SAMN05443244_2255 [Terriglobus roseus]
MSIECRPSNVCSDVRCEICGQGFLLYGERRNAVDRDSVRATVQKRLREQHNEQQHPEAGFLVDWAPVTAEAS